MYLDETWVNARDGKEKMWVEDEPRASGGTREESENQVVKGVGLSYCMLAVRVDGLMGLCLFFRVRKQLVITMTK